MYTIRFFLPNNNFVIQNISSVESAAILGAAILTALDINFERVNERQFGKPGSDVGDKVFATINPQR